MMKLNTILLGYVSDGDLHTKLQDVEYSTNLREFITVGDMLRAENLKGGEVRTERLSEISSSKLPDSIKNDRLEI